MKKVLFFFVLGLFTVNIYCQDIPQMSPWDGVAYAIKDYYKKNANDPKSIEYVEVSLMMKLSNNMFVQRVKLRGKNAYGGMILNVNYFIISGTGINAEVKAVYNEDEYNNYAVLNKIKIIKKFDSSGKEVY